MYDTEIKSLINYISTVYFKTANKIRTNIYILTFILNANNL